MIAITFTLVVLMAFPTYQTLAQNDEVEGRIAATMTTSSDREPASIPTQAMKVAKPQPHFKNLDLNCAKKQFSPFNVVGNYVQLQGKNCMSNFKEGDVEITNKSNGFTASVFQSGTDKYQTDLIQLQPGENEITIRYRERTGKSVQETLRVTSTSI